MRIAKFLKCITVLTVSLLLVLGSLGTYAVTFEEGETGEAVELIQNSLCEQGYIDGRPSGVYDLVMEAAIETYKAANGIEEEGVGPETLDALGIELPEENADDAAEVLDDETRFDVTNIVADENSPLKGKTLIFLGSSVTFGAATRGVSFVDYIGARNGCNIIKSAQSGTTLADDEDPESFLGKNSYISRLKTIEEEGPVDAFICQLSTNDASHDKVLGAISESFDIEDFDTFTTYGAIEYIIAYVKDKWDCPVFFYTNTVFDNEIYAEMVSVLQDIAQKWDIGIIDLWNNAEVNEKINSNFEYYMKDDIHPYAPAYLDVWTPVFEECLYEAVK